MARVIPALLLIIVLLGCSGPGGSATPEGSDEPSPSGLEADEWDRPTTAPPPELCPENAAAVDRPGFGPAVDAPEGIVRHGIVANEQGELFRIDVTGVADDPVTGPVKTFLSEVMLCLDVLLVKGDGAAVEEGPIEAEEDPAAAFGGEDLIIEIDLLGFVDPKEREKAAKVGELSIDLWKDALGEILGYTAPGDDIQGYLIDAVIDPGVGKYTHHYRERWLTKVYAKVSVMASGGQVRGGLCKNSSYPVPSRKVTVNAGTTGPPLSYYTDPIVNRFDLGVLGLTTANRYKVAQSWTVPGWKEDYFESAPAGSLRNCYP